MKHKLYGPSKLVAGKKRRVLGNESKTRFQLSSMAPKVRMFKRLYWDGKHAEGGCGCQMELPSRHFPGVAGKYHTTPQGTADND